MKREHALMSFVASMGIGALVGLAGSDGGDEQGGIKLFLLATIVAFAINWIVFVPSYLARTEHYYDLTGSATYLIVVAIAWILSRNPDARTAIIALVVITWALRLGSFLFQRVRNVGGDGRFDRIKHDWARFLMAWTIQALWVVFTAAAALAAITSSTKKDFGVIGVIGLVVWIAGFAIEVIADQQKSAFRADPANAGTFIRAGLWSRSRHPNYFGELVLWIGVAIMAFPVLQGWQYVTLLSPVFVFLLLTRVSGVPALEARSDKKWSGQAEYEAYKDATPAFFPKLVG
ncbi:MAG: DUF1295 domain-containing protein [Acidimicrobiales bacterium]